MAIQGLVTKWSKVIDTLDCKKKHFPHKAPACCRSFEENLQIELNQRTFRQCLLQSLIQVFGKIGGAIPFEVLSVQQDGTVVFLKADKRCDSPVQGLMLFRIGSKAKHQQVQAVSNWRPSGPCCVAAGTSPGSGLRAR